MAEYEVTIAAATAVLGYDLLRDEPWTVSDNPRVINGLGLTGSAAAGDSAADLLVGQYRVARRYNTVTGFPTKDHVTPLDAYVPPGAKISLPVVDAPATNPINAKIIVEDL
jgi:hypothetical protein